MIFLIRYDRLLGKVISMQEFSDAEREAASTARLELEIALVDQEVHQEIVILEANSIEALRKTHQRYFSNIEELTRKSK